MPCPKLATLQLVLPVSSQRRSATAPSSWSETLARKRPTDDGQRLALLIGRLVGGRLGRCPTTLSMRDMISVDPNGIPSLEMKPPAFELGLSSASGEAGAENHLDAKRHAHVATCA